MTAEVHKKRTHFEHSRGNPELDMSAENWDLLGIQIVPR